MRPEALPTPHQIRNPFVLTPAGCNRSVLVRPSTGGVQFSCTPLPLVYSITLLRGQREWEVATKVTRPTERRQRRRRRWDRIGLPLAAVRWQAPHTGADQLEVHF